MKSPGATERDSGTGATSARSMRNYDAQIDLISLHPVFNLYNQDWPISLVLGSLPPAKFVFDDRAARPPPTTPSSPRV